VLDYFYYHLCGAENAAGITAEERFSPLLSHTRRNISLFLCYLSSGLLLRRLCSLILLFSTPSGAVLISVPVFYEPGCKSDHSFFRKSALKISAHKR